MGEAAGAVPAGFAKLGRLTQLESLEIKYFAIDVRPHLLVAALAPLTRITRLVLGFDEDHSGMADSLTAFPWDAAICGLTNLQEISMDSVTEHTYHCNNMFSGALPARLSQLTALRHLTVLGMKEWDARNDSSQLRLAALPALESVALRLHTLSGQIPGLCREKHVTISRLVSLKLALRINVHEGDSYADTRLPTICAPALTELKLEDMKLAPDSEQLSWLPGLPSLRRLVLKDSRPGRFLGGCLSAQTETAANVAHLVCPLTCHRLFSPQALWLLRSDHASHATCTSACGL